MRMIQAEFIKLKRTFMFPLSLGLPVIYTLILSFYFQSSHRFSIVESLIIFFELLNFSIILVSAVIVSLTIEKEFQSQHFNALLKFQPRWQLISSKLAVYFSLLSITQLSASLSLMIYFALTQQLTSSLALLLVKISISAIFANYCLIPLYLWVAFKYGLVGNVSLAIFGVVTSAIVGGTSLGTVIWLFIPFAWSRKSLNFILTNSTQLPLLLLILVGFLSLSCLMLLFWFSRWQGRASSN